MRVGWGRINAKIYSVAPSGLFHRPWKPGVRARLRRGASPLANVLPLLRSGKHPFIRFSERKHPFIRFSEQKYPFIWFSGIAFRKEGQFPEMMDGKPGTHSQDIVTSRRDGRMIARGEAVRRKASANPWKTGQTERALKGRRNFSPQIPLIKLNPIPHQQFPVFLLKSLLFMMILLNPNIMLKRLYIRAAHRECSIPILPVK